MSEFDEDKHPRDARGRFGTGSALGAWADKTAKDRERLFSVALYNKADKSGGFSYRPGGKPKERVPTTGYMTAVATDKGMNHVIQVASMDAHSTKEQVKKEFVAQVNKWLQKALPALNAMPGHFLGGWFQKTDDKDKAPVALHLDVAEHFADRDKAIQAGRDRNQMEVWDVVKGEGISTGGTGT